MQVSKNQAIELLSGLKYGSATGWSPSKLEKVIGRLPQADDLETAAEGLDARNRDMLNEIVATLESGKEVKVERAEEEKPESNGKAKKGSKAAVPTTDSKTKKTASKNGVARDRFGNREGTQAAKINVVLTSKPMTVSEVTEKSRATNVANHLRYLVVKGFVAHSKDGYALSKKGAK